MIRLGKYLFLKSKDDVNRVYLIDNNRHNIPRKDYPRNKRYKFILRIDAVDGGRYDIGFSNKAKALIYMDELEATLKDA